MATSDASQASGSFRYCARDFTAGELAEIRLLIASGQCPGRAVLAREVCLRLNWYKPDGGPKSLSINPKHTCGALGWAGRCSKERRM